MPIPSPTKSEDRAAFVSRFMSDAIMVKDYPDNKERAAIAYSQWKKINNNLYTYLSANMSQLITKNIFEGKEHLVVPTVLIVEGVLNGILYTSDELRKFPESWNGIPVPVLHSYDQYGQPMSANQPKVIEDQVVGRLWNVEFSENKLKGEVWIDIEKCRTLAPHVLEMLEKNEQIEVSTGLFTEDEHSLGIFNGKEYKFIAHNFRPDHLAILPNLKGACGWEDGAGLPRINSEIEKVPVDGEIQTKIKGESQMEREVKINALITSGAWSESDKNFLTELSDEHFEKIEGISMKENENEEAVKAELEVVQTELKENKLKLNEAMEQIKENSNEKSLDELLALVSPELKKSIEKGLEAYKENKAKVISKIVANKKNVFTADELEVKEIDELTKISNLCVVDADYSAKGGVVVKDNKQNKETVPQMAEMEWSK